MDTIENREREKIEELAQLYQVQGYEVTRTPHLSWLPEPLAGYRPDLLLRKGDEILVVEVKSREELASSTQIRDLARAIESRPGWRLQLVVLGSDERTLSLREARPLEEEEILDRIEEARELESSFPEAGLLFAWATAEAALRLAALREGIVLKRFDPMYLLKELATNAAISQEDYYTLVEIMKMRNALAHGLKPESFNASSTETLLAITQRLLADSARAQAG